MTNDTNNEEKNKPIHVIKSANFTKASIWRNEDKNGNVTYSVTVDRSYQKDGKWHRTSFFQHDEIPLVRKLYLKAEQWLDDHLLESDAA
jgi:hypothetical protein